MLAYCVQHIRLSSCIYTHTLITYLLALNTLAPDCPRVNLHAVHDHTCAVSLTCV